MQIQTLEAYYIETDPQVAWPIENGRKVVTKVMFSPGETEHVKVNINPSWLNVVSLKLL